MGVTKVEAIHFKVQHWKKQDIADIWGFGIFILHVAHKPQYY